MHRAVCLLRICGLLLIVGCCRTDALLRCRLLLIAGRRRPDDLLHCRLLIHAPDGLRSSLLNGLCRGQLRGRLNGLLCRLRNRIARLYGGRIIAVRLPLCATVALARGEGIRFHGGTSLSADAAADLPGI